MWGAHFGGNKPLWLVKGTFPSFCTLIILLILTIMLCFRHWCAWRPFRIGVWPARGWYDGFVSSRRLKIRRELSTWRSSVPLTRSWWLKTKVLAEETCRLEEAKKVKTNLATKLAALREQMEKARANAVAEFHVSQPFFDACGLW